MALRFLSQALDNKTAITHVRKLVCLQELFHYHRTSHAPEQVSKGHEFLNDFTGDYYLVSKVLLGKSF